MTIHPKLFVGTTIASILIWANCSHTTLVEPLPIGATKIAESAQRTGDPTIGAKYLMEGDYVSSGIPFEIFKTIYGNTSPDDLGRTGDNKGIASNFTVVTAFNGVKVVATNCFNCHADRLPDGKLTVGLGNTTADNTRDVTQQFALLDQFVKTRYGANSAEWKAYFPLSRGFSSIAPYIKTETQGANPADKIFAALAAFRKADDLTWLSTPQFAIPSRVVPSDVPAWWLMRKKHALYYNALGTGDFARLSMATALVSMSDSTEARRIDTKFPDVMAYLRTLRPPQYPYAIDQTLVAKGKSLFITTCARCHGSYGTGETYPNLLIDLEEIDSDPALANEYAQHPEFHTWYNKSWFNKGAPTTAGQFQPTHGYIAPPLDGIWATAPYLHNGSVPTLDDMLNSKNRPAKWSRTFDNTIDFDQQKIGWKYKIETAKSDIKTYDTTIYGYGNGGHTYGDGFTTDERKAVIEYLKTL